MQSDSKQWLKLVLSVITFMAVWYLAFLVFDNYGVYFGWLFAGVCAYLVYHLSSFLSDV